MDTPTGTVIVGTPELQDARIDRVLAEVSSLREENRRLTKVVKDLEKNTKTRRTLFKQAGDPES